MIDKVSKELLKRNIFHKIEKNFIITRKSKIKIPAPNKDIAYILGVIEGDGSLNITKRKRGGFHYLLRIYSGEEKYLHYLNVLFSKLFNLKGRVIKDARKNSSYCLRIQNASLFHYFVILGSEIGKKKIGKIPQMAKTKKENLLHYLSGLVDTDGSIYGKRIQLKQKRLNLMKEIEQLSKKINLNCTSPKTNFTNNIPFYYIRFDNKIPLRLKQTNF